MATLNDPGTIRRLVSTPARWAVVGLSACTTTALGAWLATLLDPFVGNILFAAFLTAIAVQLAVRAVRLRRRPVRE